MAAVSTLPAEELPFLAEIGAAPDDDGPRLVFADWLEERGDIRGEMLRIGCALARLELDDPQYDALAAREAELREPCKAEWLARLPQVKDVKLGTPNPYRFDAQMWRRGEEPSPFQRGLLDHLTANGNETTDFRSLIESYGVRELTVLDYNYPPAGDAIWEHIHALSALGRRDVLTLLRSRRLGTVRALGLGDMGVYDALRTAGGNASLGQLEALAISDVLNDDVLNAIQEWPHQPLRKVHLVESRTERPSDITAAGLTKCLVAPVASRLQVLTLSGVEFGPLAHITLGSANLRTLRWLFLCNAGLQRATPEALGMLAGLPQLDWLSLAINQLGDGAVASLAPSLHAGLRRLELEHNRLGAKATAALAGAQLSGLRRLRLAHNLLNDEAAIQLAACPQLAGLIELDLFQNQIGDKGALALAESPHLTSLKRLDLFNNPIKRAYTRECLTERFGAGVSLSPA